MDSSPVASVRVGPAVISYAREPLVSPRDRSGDEVCRIFLFPKLPVASCSSYDRQNPLVFKFSWHRFVVNNEHILGRNQPLAGFVAIEYSVVRPDRRSITVAFWNMQWFPGGHPNPSRNDKLRQIGSVRADMARFNPDVLGMAEVMDFTNATMAVKPWLGFKVDVCANFPPREGHEQAQEVAIASRLQPLSAWAELWKPHDALVPPRGFAFAAYQLAPDRLLLFYAVHLKSNLGEIEENIAIREESMRQLRSHMAAMQQAYAKLGRIIWALGGDCNTSLDDDRFAAETTLRRLIDNGFVWCWKNVSPLARVPPTGPRVLTSLLDHIFVRGAAIRKAWVVRSSAQSSDHRPVVAVLDL